MLTLPRIGTTLRTMGEAGILTLSEETLRLLHTYERRARRPDIAARLALVMAETGPRQLKALWRLSNDDIESAKAILVTAALMREFRLNEAAYRHPAALADGVEVAAVMAGWTEAGRLAVIEELHALNVRTFSAERERPAQARHAAGQSTGRGAGTARAGLDRERVRAPGRTDWWGWWGGRRTSLMARPRTVRGAAPLHRLRRSPPRAAHGRGTLTDTTRGRRLRGCGP